MFSDYLDELIGLTDHEIEEQIEANEMERRRNDAQMSALLAVATARNLHNRDAHRTMTAYCRAKLNWSTTEAGRRLGLARAIDNIPGLGQAWSAGHIGYPQAIKIAVTNNNKRITDQLADFAPQLLEHAEQLKYSDFSDVIEHFVSQADQDGAHDERDQAIEGRTARAVDVGGTLHLQASGGDGLITAEMITILNKFTDIEFANDVEANRHAHSNNAHGDDADGFTLARSDRQRRFDALAAIFRTASAAQAAGVAGTPAEFVVNIVADAATWGRMLLAAGLTVANDLDANPIDPFTGLSVDDANDVINNLSNDLANAHHRICETTNGVQLHPHDVLRAALAGHIRRTIVDSDRVVIDHGRKQRLFTGNARQAAKLLIKRCERAGCELPADWCDVDHNLEWGRDNGPTNQRNTAILCRADNNDKHHRKWRIKRASNGCSYTIRADGSIVLPVGARPPHFNNNDRTEHQDEHEDDRPEDIARQTSLALTRLDNLARPSNH